MISTCWVDSMFIRDDFPEFSTDLVTALTSLNVNKFSHFFNVDIFNLSYLNEEPFGFK